MSVLKHKRAKEALTAVRNGSVTVTTGTKDRLHDCGVLGSLIWQMEKEGLVLIRPVPREKTRVRLTEAGRSALESLQKENRTA